MKFPISAIRSWRKERLQFWAPAAIFVAALLAGPRLLRAQTPTPTFSPEIQTIVNVNYGTNLPGYAAVGDFNGDGHMDALVTDGGPNIHLLLGNGDGTFTDHEIAMPGIPNPGAIQAADLNGDGRLDAVFGNNAGNEGVTVLLNTGNDANGVPQFTVTTYAVGLPGIRSVTIGDLNGDGHPDLIVGDCCGTFRVLLNNGDGTFTLGQTYSIMPSNGGPSVGPGVIADLNGDGKADYVVVSAEADATDIFYGNGDGTFQNPVVLPGQAYDVAVADLNGDGRPDIILGTAGNVAVYLNQGGGTFSAPVFYSTSNDPQASNYVTSVAVADLTGDGSLNVVATNYVDYTQQDPGRSVAVFPVNSNGTLGALQLFTDELDPTAVAIADFNGDGKPDIGTVGYASRTYNVLLNTTPALSAATASAISAPAITYGQSGQVTVTVTAASGSAAPSGEVSLSVDGGAAITQTLGSGSGTSSSALFTLTDLGAGTHTLAASYATQPGFSASSAQGSLTVAPATLTVTANNAVTSYGAGLPLFSGSVSGAQYSDTFTESFTTLANISSPAGTYAITPSVTGTALANYNVVYQSGVLTIDPAPLTISADAQSKVLNAPNPALTASYAGFVLGEGPGNLSGTLSCTTTAVLNSPVGSYPITCSGLSSTNYAITYEAGTLRVLYLVGACPVPQGDHDQDGNHHPILSHVILDPIKADGSSSFDGHGNVPVRFRVCDANGNSIGDKGLIVSFVSLNGPQPTSLGDRNDQGWHFDGHRDQDQNSDGDQERPNANPKWTYHLSLRPLTPATYNYLITLNDGTTIPFSFSVKAGDADHSGGDR